MPYEIEDTIERAVERRADELAVRLKIGDLTHTAYDAALRELDSWAEERYVAARRWPLGEIDQV